MYSDVVVLIGVFLICGMIGMLVNEVMEYRRIKRSKHIALARKKDLIKQSDKAQREKYMAELRFIERYGE